MRRSMNLGRPRPLSEGVFQGAAVRLVVTGATLVVTGATLVVTGATLVVTGATLVVTRS